MNNQLSIYNRNRPLTPSPIFPSLIFPYPVNPQPLLPFLFLNLSPPLTFFSSSFFPPHPFLLLIPPHSSSSPIPYPTPPFSKTTTWYRCVPGCAALQATRTSYPKTSQHFKNEVLPISLNSAKQNHSTYKYLWLDLSNPLNKIQ
jgi:hypothetical protein